MANVPNGVKTLLKISIARVGCTNVTDRRQTDGRRHIANMNTSSRSLKTCMCVCVATLLCLLTYWQLSSLVCHLKHIVLRCLHTIFTLLLWLRVFVLLIADARCFIENSVVRWLCSLCSLSCTVTFSQQSQCHQFIFNKHNDNILLILMIESCHDSSMYWKVPWQCS